MEKLRSLLNWLKQIKQNVVNFLDDLNPEIEAEPCPECGNIKYRIVTFPLNVGNDFVFDHMMLPYNVIYLKVCNGCGREYQYTLPKVLDH